MLPRLQRAMIDGRILKFMKTFHPMDELLPVVMDVRLVTAAWLRFALLLRASCETFWIWRQIKIGSSD